MDRPRVYYDAKTHYDAGEIHGGELRGLLLCTENHRYHTNSALAPITADPERVTCEQCLLKMGRAETITNT